jgi:hypothetical protein
MFIIPYIINYNLNLSWLCISSFLFSLFASFYHLFPYDTYYLKFIIKSLYTQFLFSSLENKIENKIENNYISILLSVSGLCISILDMLPIYDYNKFELVLGAIRFLICLILWYLSKNKGITATVYIAGQLMYCIDRNIRIKNNPNMSDSDKRKSRSNYTYYHCILHIADIICFCYWLN